MNYIKTVEFVNNLLIENDEWISRYKKYSKKITTNQQLHKDGRTKFKIPTPFHLYTNISNLYSKNPSYDIRFLGQSVATLKLNQEIVTISTNKKNTKNKKYFGINITLSDELWDSTQSSTFRKSFKQCETIKGRSPEHTVESALLSEFKQKNKKTEKKELKKEILSQSKNLCMSIHDISDSLRITSSHAAHNWDSLGPSS